MLSLKTTKTYLATLLAVIVFVFSFSLSVSAQGTKYDPFKDLCEGTGKESSVCKGNIKSARDDVSGQRGLVGKNGTLTRIVQTLVYVATALSVVVIMVGGLRYVASGGDSGATKGAKDTIQYAIIGLVVALFAQVIVSFVLGKL